MKYNNKEVAGFRKMKPGLYAIVCATIFGESLSGCLYTMEQIMEMFDIDREDFLCDLI